jgi:hypothetical protein
MEQSNNNGRAEQDSNTYTMLRILFVNFCRDPIGRSREIASLIYKKVTSLY